MKAPNPEVVVKHVIRLMGGHDKAFEVFDSEFKEIVLRWEQDTGMIGRILRAHLFVEHYLTNFLQSRNPNLGSLDEARITFAQKVNLMGDGTPGTEYLIPGIRRLNKIRNRIAHTLSAEITDEDVKTFLNIGMFRAMREEKARRLCLVPSMEPIVVMEEFAIHAGMILASAASWTADVWMKAFQAAEEECSKDDATQ